MEERKLEDIVVGVIHNSEFLAVSFFLLSIMLCILIFRNRNRACLCHMHKG